MILIDRHPYFKGVNPPLTTASLLSSSPCFHNISFLVIPSPPLFFDVRYNSLCNDKGVDAKFKKMSYQLA